MKLHIVKPNQEAVENYEKAIVFNNDVNLSEVSDNECEVIMANDAVDEFDINKVGELVQKLRQKLRMGGKLVLGGTDIRILCKSIINDQISEKEGSSIIGSIKSASNATLIKQALESVGLNVLSTQITGVHYEVSAERK